MLKSIVFLLVLVTFITTPTQAYEAYHNIASLLILEKEELIEQKIIEKALPLKENLKKQISSSKSVPQNYELCQIAINEVEQTHNIKPRISIWCRSFVKASTNGANN